MASEKPQADYAAKYSRPDATGHPTSMSVDPFSASPVFKAEQDRDKPELTEAEKATDDPYHPKNFDLVSFSPQPSEYSPSETFMHQVKQYDGVFNGTVIEACFRGVPRLLQNRNYGMASKPPSFPEVMPSHVVMMCAEVATSCWFGLLLDQHNKVLLKAHTLQASPPQATFSTEGDTYFRIWSDSAISHLDDLADKFRNKWYNAFIDPTTGEEQFLAGVGEINEAEATDEEIAVHEARRAVYEGLYDHEELHIDNARVDEVMD